MVLTTKSNTSSIPTSSTKPSPTISTSWTQSTNKETKDYRDDTTNGYDSESTDDSQYANFLSFLSTPSNNKSRSELSIKTECIDVAKRQTTELVNSCCPTETIEQLMNGSDMEEQGIETDIKHHTFSKSISEDEGSAWKSDDGDSLMTDDDYEAFTALVAPNTTAAPTNTAADVLPAKRTKEDTKRTTPTKSKSARTTTTATEKIELPEYTKSASVATLYFETEAIKKQKEMESNRTQVVNNKEPMEPLPIDHFTKLGEKETTERTESMKKLAEESMPIAISKMTDKATQDKLEHETQLKKLSEEQMSDATRHFKKLDNDKKKAPAASSTSGEIEIMPAAIQRFTLADRELKAKKKAELDELKSNPEPLPAAQEFFTNKDREDKAKKAAELQEMKENPPPASVATEYFHKKEEERKVELEAMQNEPAPAAIEYFTTKAAEEKSKRDLMLKEMNESPPEASVATQYFERQESIKAAEMEAIRSQVKNKEPMEPLPIDYFTKLGEEEQSNKALAQRELSESQMPIAVKKMTDKAAQDKAANEEAQRKLSQEEMSSATKHFHALEDEKKKALSSSVADSEKEIMPAAIQRFTLADREQKANKNAELEELKSNPEPLPAAQEFFTNKDREDKAKKAAELQEMKENPPPASVATEYFHKKEEERKIELEAMQNEPAPAAIEYFTTKAAEEKSKRDLMLKEMNESPPEASVATQYFEKEESIKAAEIEAARLATRQKIKNGSGSSQRRVDWAELTQQKAPVVPPY